MTVEDIKRLALELVDQLKSDIAKAVTREEHIRMTARANEAHHLLQHLHSYFVHTDGQDNEDLSTNRGS